MFESRKTWIVAVLLLLAVTVGACGFQVRGTSNLPAKMERTYILADDNHSGFYQRLRDELRQADIEVVDSPADATSIFSILHDVTSQRVVAVSARNVPREYEVYYIVSYTITSGQDTLMDERTQTQTRAYTWDETKVLGKIQEEQLLRDAIVDDLVRVVMMQISTL